MVYGTPSIITNGLRILLDSQNVKSYPGTGTIWTDLSGNGNHMTLFNNPSFSNGAFSITSSGTEYTEISSSNTGFLSGSWTLQLGFIPLGVNGSGYGRILTIFNNIELALSNSFTARINDGSGWVGPFLFTFTSQWQLFTIIKTGGNYNFYYNMNPTSLYTKSVVGNAGNQIISLGRWNISNTENCSFNIKTFTMYNRALTQQEINVNYNSFKSKLGIF